MVMLHRGYAARVEFDDGESVFRGEVVATREPVTFRGTSVAELRAAFVSAVDEYLARCEVDGVDPVQRYSGLFVARVGEALHRESAAAAGKDGLSLNAWVVKVLRQALARGGPS